MSDHSFSSLEGVSSTRKKVTIRDIAEKANVSVSTVSRVLNESSFVEESKRKAVIEAARSLEYQPNAAARSLVTGQTFTIGVIANFVGNPFGGNIIKGIATELQGSKYSPVIVDAYWEPTIKGKVFQGLASREVDGMIFIGGAAAIEELNEFAQRTPTIVVAREIESWQQNNIFIDNIQGAFDATEFLIQAGHRDIAFISGITGKPGRNDSDSRLKGYQKALEKHQIGYNPDLYVISDFSAAGAVMAVETLFSREAMFSAIFCCNDQAAFGVRHALAEKGIRVPDDVSLLGFDDHSLSAYMQPPLTTVRQPTIELGQEAARSLLDLIDGKPVECKALKTELVIRKSVLNRRLRY